LTTVQSTTCQKADWKKEHKYNCSPLNEPVRPAKYTPEQLEAEVAKASSLLKEWLEKVNADPEAKVLPQGTKLIRGMEVAERGVLS
jgi:hypothetical protein